jgi:hypothetical protein
MLSPYVMNRQGLNEVEKVTNLSEDDSFCGRITACPIAFPYIHRCRVTGEIRSYIAASDIV